MFLLAAGQSAASSAAPGAIGFLVVAGMGLAIFFLFRSMTKHLRKVNLAADKRGGAPGEGRAAGRARSGRRAGCRPARRRRTRPRTRKPAARAPEPDAS